MVTAGLRLSLLGLLGLLVAAQVGCYQRVVREEGLGTGVREVYEPSVEEESDADPWNLSGGKGSRETRNWKAVGASKK